MRKPLCIELFAGLHGWGEGFTAEGFRVIGFDIVDMCSALGRSRPLGIDLVLQDVLTLHGSQFREAACIVASPPCQKYSYMAMPWSRAKAQAAAYREEPARIAELNALFDACFRIQAEASEAAGHRIPLVVENVKGAQPWVGRAAWHYGSFYLWGDVPVLMPFAMGRKVAMNFHEHEKTGKPGRSFQSTAVEGMKTVAHANQRDGFSHTRHLTNQRESDALKCPGLNWNGHGKPGYKPQGFNVTNAQRYREGVKQEGLSGPAWFDNGAAAHSSRSDSRKAASRKAASAQIAKIPFPLANHIARVFKPCA